MSGASSPRRAGIPVGPMTGPRAVSGTRHTCETMPLAVSPDAARFIELADGSEITIRPIRAADRSRELAFLRGLSRESRYQRLLSSRNLLPGELSRLVVIDRSREQALVATTVADDGSDAQIGVARYVHDGEAAEIAIVVADAFQRRGLGEALLSALIEEACADGIPTLYGIALFTNRGMLRLAQKLGFRLVHQPGDATLMRMTRELRAPALSCGARIRGVTGGAAAQCERRA
jgi:GNAT superfamily N-acetyltransferase